MEISIFKCRAICLAASELGAIQALIRTGRLRPYLKKADAFRLYGRKNITHWVQTGLLTPRKDGDHSACWRIDRVEVEIIAKANALLRYR